jgi:hypothetical protein
MEQERPVGDVFDLDAVDCATGADDRIGMIRVRREDRNVTHLAVGLRADEINRVEQAPLVVNRAYTCSHRGGTFTAKLALHLSVVNQAGKQPGRGSWTIIHAGGALHGLSATGSERGVARGCAPVGTALAKCSAGTDSVTGTRKRL